VLHSQIQTVVIALPPARFGLKSFHCCVSSRQIVSAAICERGFSMAKTSISSTELLWIFREKLSLFGDGFKDAPIAIVPSKDGWEVVTSHRYRNAELQLAKRIAQIQAELRPLYRLARD
jgi:hypothetical protein